jgi:predicted nucleic acid-binding protein
MQPTGAGANGRRDGRHPPRHRRLFVSDEGNRHARRPPQTPREGENNRAVIRHRRRTFHLERKRGWGAKKISDLEQRIKTAVIVPYDLDLCRQFGQIKAEMLKVGRQVPSNDLWIAACALRHSISLVTHNAKDFAGIPGLKIITEVEPPKPQKTAVLFPDHIPPDEK